MNTEKKLSDSFDENVKTLDELFAIEKNFDFVGREMKFSSHRTKFYFIDSFVDTDVLERIMIFLAELGKSESLDSKSIKQFANEKIPYGEVTLTEKLSELAYMVMSGPACVIIDSFPNAAIVLDVRSYPSRSIDEPSNDKVLRGARDGFIEAVKPNICMMRRRIRDTSFRAEKICVGKESRTDVALCYIEGKADSEYVENLKRKLESLDVASLTLGHQSLAEALVPYKWYNPFPKFRYTERPDAAAASILEGSVILLCDTSPEAMILPTGIFDFLQESGDYYLPPFTGSYLRVLRHFVFFITLILTPLWYLLIKNPEVIPPALDFIKIQSEYKLPVIFQLFITEFALDGLKLASLNTPDTLNNSLSVVGGLILGDFAVETGWLIPEVIVYMAIVAISNFTQPSYELGYAFKFMRMLLLLLTALFDIWGFVIGLVLVLFFVVSNNTVDGSRSYLYPLIPFNGKALKRVLLRVPSREANVSGDEGKNQS